jgi:hypothetical protein
VVVTGYGVVVFDGCYIGLVYLNVNEDLVYRLQMGPLKRFCSWTSE